MTGSRSERTSHPGGGRVAVILALLYPRPWRERYGEELLELLGSRRLSTTTIVATLRGALDAHAHLPDLLPGACEGSVRLRWYTMTTFAAWVAFCAATAAVAKTMEAPAFASAAHGHVALSVLQTVARAAFAVAALAICLGGVPLAGTAVRQALRQRDRFRLGLLALPLIAGIVTVGLAELLSRLHSGPVHSANTVWLAVGLVAVALLGAVIVVRAAGALLHETQLPPRVLRFAGAAAVVAATAMTVAVAAGAGYGVAVRLETPALFFSRNGVLATPLIATWLAALLLAAAGVFVVDRATIHSLPALLRGR
jgi:hypothetical protein